MWFGWVHFYKTLSMHFVCLTGSWKQQCFHLACSLPPILPDDLLVHPPLSHKCTLHRLRSFSYCLAYWTYYSRWFLEKQRAATTRSNAILGHCSQLHPLHPSYRSPTASAFHFPSPEDTRSKPNSVYWPLLSFGCAWSSPIYVFVFCFFFSPVGRLLLSFLLCPSEA